MLRGRALGQILWATPNARCPERVGPRLVAGHVPAPRGRYRSRMPDERRFLEMDDGVRIALTLHFPDTPPPWPVVFEARPYRKDDFSDATAIYRRLCDEGGLAVCRADVRGTGSSEGVAEDEYTARELPGPRRDDRVARRAGLVERQRGDVRHVVLGLQLAPGGRAPPARAEGDHPDLRDRPTLHRRRPLRRRRAARDRLPRLPGVHGRPASRLPPVPSVYGEGWREEWLRRIEANEPWELAWLEHQNEDDYWRHGSVFFDYDSIEAATLVIAGHADGYRNMAFRAFERLRGPKKILFGPWSHMSPRLSMPGPRIDHVPVMIDVVAAVARRRRERRRRAADLDLRSAVDRPGTGLRHVQRRVASRAGVASGAARRGPAPARLGGGVCPRRLPARPHEDGRARDPRRRRRDGVDLVRGDAPVRRAVGPTSG